MGSVLKTETKISIDINTIWVRSVEIDDRFPWADSDFCFLARLPDRLFEEALAWGFRKSLFQKPSATGHQLPVPIPVLTPAGYPHPFFTQRRARKGQPVSTRAPYSPVKPSDPLT